MTDNQLTLPFGVVRPFGDNEVEHIALYLADPPKYRFGLSEMLVESNLGMTSFNTVRSDGMHDEWATIGARMIDGPTGRCAAIALSVRDRTTHDVREVMLIAPHGIWCNVPLHGPGAPGGENDGTVAMSRNGRWWVVMQDDGNLVQYPLMTPFDKTTGVATWASGDGR